MWLRPAPLVQRRRGASALSVIGLGLGRRAQWLYLCELHSNDDYHQSACGLSMSLMPCVGLRLACVQLTVVD